MKVQPPAKGVRYEKDVWNHIVMGLYPAINHGSCKSRNIAQQSTILLKIIPKNLRHREADLRISDVWQGTPLLTLPSEGRSVTAARTKP
jgi:hypothetical protein